MNSTPSKYYAFLGLFLTSTSSVFIRIIDAPALAIATYRLVAGSLLLMIPFIISHYKKQSSLNKEGFMLSVLSGLFLAGHFATWITSLEYTTVASSTVLVALSPMFVALYNFAFLKERLSRIQLIGIFISIIGAIIISSGDVKVSGEALFGDLLAFLGAIFVSGYIILGRKVREYLTLTDYAFVVYSTASIALLVLSYTLSINLKISSTQQITLMLLHGIVCSGLGHSVYNWMLQHFSSTYISTVTLGEPVIASILVFLILGEVPTVQTLAGGIIVITGLYIFVKSNRFNRRISNEI